MAQLCEIAQVGTGSIVEQPPENVGFSVLVDVRHPPAVVAKS